MEVTDSYREAVSAAARSEKIKGYIKFNSGEKLQITDENIIQGSLSLDEQICFGSFKIGTFNSAQLKIAIYDDSARERDFSNAAINLNYGIMLKSGVYIYIPLGRYNVDGGLLKRRRDRVYLTAFDNGIRFGKSKPPDDMITDKNVYSALKKICSDSRVSLSMTEEDILALPNGGMKITLTDPQMQTNRDCVMWIAALLGCCAKINREGKLEIKKIVYKTDTETEEIFPDWTISGDERKSTVFSDTRTFVKYMTGYSGGKIKQYTSKLVAEDEQAVEGVLALPQNPIVKKLAEEEADEINQNICNGITRFLQRGIETEIFGNPALECGETIRLNGGVLDVGRKIIGVVTRRVWRYRRSDKLYCQMHDVWTPVADDEEESGGGSGETVSGGYIYITPKSQTEKRIDALYETVSTFKAENPVCFFEKTQTGYNINGIDYSWEKNAGGFISRVTDSGGNIFYPNVPEAGDCETFNQILLPVLFSRGITSNEKPPVNFVTKWDLKKGSGGNTLTIPSQAGEFNCLVDWGDGTVTSHTSGSLVHEYASLPEDKIVSVSITGQYNGICTGTATTASTAVNDRLIEVSRWGNVGFTSMRNAFSYTNYLSKLPDAPLTGAENVADFYQAFSKAGELLYTISADIKLHVPDYFFSKCVKAASFNQTFYGCYNMTVGRGLFKNCGEASDFSGTFMGMPQVYIDNEMFKGCQNAALFTSCFYSDAVKTLVFEDKAFFDCVNITDISGLANTYYSSGKCEIHGTMFNLAALQGKIINCANAFRSNSGAITGSAPPLWNYINASSSVTRCFNGGTALTNYGEIPSSWK